jgi:hypothetical protein
MPVIIPVDYCMVSVVHSLENDTEPIVNTFGLHCVDEGVITSDLADDVMTEWGVAFAPIISSAYSIDQVVLYGFNGLGSSEIFVSTIAPIPCTNVGAPLPQNSALLIRKRTDAAGRRGRGRMYLAGIAENVVSPTGDIDDATVAYYQGAATDFFDAVQLLTQVEDMVVLHRSEGIGSEPPPTPITSLQVQKRIATQRRRLRP